jgi:ankyrin repeat protein
MQIMVHATKLSRLELESVTPSVLELNNDQKFLFDFLKLSTFQEFLLTGLTGEKVSFENLERSYLELRKNAEPYLDKLIMAVMVYYSRLSEAHMELLVELHPRGLECFHDYYKNGVLIVDDAAFLDAKQQIDLVKKELLVLAKNVMSMHEDFYFGHLVIDREIVDSLNQQLSHQVVRWLAPDWVVSLLDLTDHARKILLLSVDCNLYQTLESLFKVMSDNFPVNLKRKSDGYSLLMMAVDAGYLNIVNLLLTRIKDIDYQSNNGDTALHLAIKKGNVDIVRSLLNSGASVEVFNPKEGYNALHLAAKSKNIELFRIIASFNTNLDIKTLHSERTPLQLAVASGYKDIVVELISKGANLFIRTGLDNHPTLFLVVQNGDQELFEFLLAQYEEAPFNSLNEGELTSLLKLATYYGQESMVDCLLKKHIEIGHALHLAAEKGSITIVDLFVQYGHSLLKTNDDGDTPFIVAIKEQQIHLVEHCINQYGVELISSNGFQEEISLAQRLFEEYDLEVFQRILSCLSSKNPLIFAGQSPTTTAQDVPHQSFSKKK